MTLLALPPAALIASRADHVGVLRAGHVAAEDDRRCRCRAIRPRLAVGTVRRIMFRSRLSPAERPRRTSLGVVLKDRVICVRPGARPVNSSICGLFGSTSPGRRLRWTTRISVEVSP